MTKRDQQVKQSASDHDGRKKKDAAALLPILGLLLFVTPLISLTVGADESTQLTRSAVYVFSAWFLLIILAFILSKALKKTNELD